LAFYGAVGTFINDSGIELYLPKPTSWQKVQ
jgi:hypothetical protein